MNPINEWQIAPQARPSLRVLCAWCGCESPANIEAPRTAQVSHGICHPCARRHFGIELAPAAARAF